MLNIEGLRQYKEKLNKNKIFNKPPFKGNYYCITIAGPKFWNSFETDIKEEISMHTLKNISKQLWSHTYKTWLEFVVI